MGKKVNFRAEFELTPVRHLSVQCPYCGKWFMADQIAREPIDYEYQIHMSDFDCPLCKEFFNTTYSGKGGFQAEVENASSEEVYRDCLKKNKVVTWESFDE